MKALVLIIEFLPTKLSAILLAILLIESSVATFNYINDLAPILTHQYLHSDF